jgi:septum site-determining protein MinD
MANAVDFLDIRANGGRTLHDVLAGGAGRSPPADRIAGLLDTELLGHVPHDEAISKAQDAGQPAVSYRPHSAAAEAYREVAAALRKRPDMLGMTVTTNTGGFRFGDGDDGTDAFADGGNDAGREGRDDGFTTPFG